MSWQREARAVARAWSYALKGVVVVAATWVAFLLCLAVLCPWALAVVVGR